MATNSFKKQPSSCAECRNMNDCVYRRDREWCAQEHDPNFYSKEDAYESWDLVPDMWDRLDADPNW